LKLTSHPFATWKQLAILWNDGQFVSPYADPRGQIRRTSKRFVKILKFEYACCIYARNLIYSDMYLYCILYFMGHLHPYFSFNDRKNTREYCEVTPKTKFFTSLNIFDLSAVSVLDLYDDLGFMFFTFWRAGCRLFFELCQEVFLKHIY